MSDDELDLPEEGSVEIDPDPPVDYDCPNCGTDIQDSSLYLTEDCEHAVRGNLASLLRFRDGELVFGVYTECVDCGEVYGGTTDFHDHDEEELHTHDD